MNSTPNPGRKLIVNLSAQQRAVSPRSFVLLAPPEASSVGQFHKIVRDNAMFRHLQSSMQRMRGRIYLQDGAISRADIAADGRHVLPSDDQSWHLLTIDGLGSVVGCTRFLRHRRDLSFNDLRVRDAAIASSHEWGPKFRALIENEISAARNAGFAYVEFGGWALDNMARCTSDCLRGVLATFAWSRLIGGVLGICTATERNHSAAILQKLGGRNFEFQGESMPSYYDERYGCRMHLLRFDSRAPNPRYEEPISRIEQTLRSVPVIASDGPVWKTMARSLCPISEIPLMPAELLAGAA